MKHQNIHMYKIYIIDIYFVNIYHWYIFCMCASRFFKRFLCVCVCVCVLHKIIKFLSWILSEITDVNYSKPSTESISLENIYDNAIDENTNVKNVFDEVSNNRPKIINDVPFSTSILVLPANKKQETSLDDR